MDQLEVSVFIATSHSTKRLSAAVFLPRSMRTALRSTVHVSIATDPIKVDYQGIAAQNFLLYLLFTNDFAKYLLRGRAIP